MNHTRSGLVLPRVSRRKPSFNTGTLKFIRSASSRVVSFRYVSAWGFVDREQARHRFDLDNELTRHDDVEAVPAWV